MYTIVNDLWFINQGMCTNVRPHTSAMYAMCISRQCSQATATLYPEGEWICCNNGVFPKWSRTFAEFTEFRETDKSLKHELGLI